MEHGAGEATAVVVALEEEGEVRGCRVLHKHVLTNLMADGGHGAMPMRGYPEDTERKLRGYLVKLADQDVSDNLPAIWTDALCDRGLT